MNHLKNVDRSEDGAEEAKISAGRKMAAFK